MTAAWRHRLALLAVIHEAVLREPAAGPLSARLIPGWGSVMVGLIAADMPLCMGYMGTGLTAP